MSLIRNRPSFSEPEAKAWLAESFGLAAGSLTSLPGERDQNFLVRPGKGPAFVFKISNVDESPEFLEAQQALLERVQVSCDFIPRSLPTRNGSLLEVVRRDGVTYLLRAVGYLPGTPLAQLKKPSPALLGDLGGKLARLDQAMRGFDHPILHRQFDWNLLSGVQVVLDHVQLIEDEATHRSVADLIARIEPRFAAFRAELRQSAIHNDANDYNVIVSPHRGADGERCVGGIIDFGDMAWSFVIAELAIATAYVVCRREDWLQAACEVVAGYHRVLPLREVETACLFDLLVLRLCVSACMSAKQQRERPDDSYLSVSQQPIRRTLPRLAAAHPRFVECRFREVCGFEPCSGSRRIMSWIDRQRATLFPVMGTELRRDNTEVIELDPASPRSAVFARTDLADEQLAAARTARVQGRQDRYVIGRYNEPRLIYCSELFAAPGAREIDERRTIHLGLDVFAPARTLLFAPLDGQVVLSEFRDRDQDYGGLVVLQHETDEGSTFHTLFGHLSRAAVEQLHPGERISAGQAVGQLGTPAENGGWTPHLHFQVIVDLFDQAGDFPGVAYASERATWTSLSPDPSSLMGIHAEVATDCGVDSNNTTLLDRARHIGANLSVAYRRPLTAVRGWMQYLFDDLGRRYLDAYNNVPHVGHCHPRVVKAAARQLSTLNTNTRYPHALLNEYATRLCDTLPDSLEVCYMLNSASEANELALRLARAATGRQGVVVQASAYHGHTTSLIDISPYKHDGPGGQGAPPWVHTLPLPDCYRGPFRGRDGGEQFAADAVTRIRQYAASAYPPAALIAETCPSVAGQIIPPDEYFPLVYEAIRSIGALAIADEVQTGFGRLGTNFWAFENYGVTPDIVVMGKPMGNGHPMAAVVTTRAIAEKFDNGMEFFSTFGGNTVSCAIGMAVLDVLVDEQLQAQALATGKALAAGFRELASRYAIIGDARGAGLFWGLELVRCRETLEPADCEASLVVNRMRERGILIGTDGPLHNVLKIRPPMQFDRRNADTLVELLDEILAEEFDSEAKSTGLVHHRA